MKDYLVLWCDGKGIKNADPRGYSPNYTEDKNKNNYIFTHIYAENAAEMWKIAFLLRGARIIKSASAENLTSMKNIWYKKRKDIKKETIEELFEKNEYKNNYETREDFHNLNTYDIIAGENPWIVKITLNDKIIYDDLRERYKEDIDTNW